MSDIIVVPVNTQGNQGDEATQPHKPVKHDHKKDDHKKDEPKAEPKKDKPKK